MKNSLLPLCLLLAQISFCQDSAKTKYPVYKHSIGVEALYAGNIVDAINGGAGVGFPQIDLSFEARIKNKFYAEVAFRPYLWWLRNTEYEPPYSVMGYTGVIFKQKLFKNFYFTPSFDFYFENRTTASNAMISYVNIFSIGPTLGVEYFISKRISLNSDLLNLNWSSQSIQNESWTWRLYKGFSLGVHYNFDFYSGE